MLHGLKTSPSLIVSKCALQATSAIIEQGIPGIPEPHDLKIFCGLRENGSGSAGKSGKGHKVRRPTQDIPTYHVRVSMVREKRVILWIRY